MVKIIVDKILRIIRGRHQLEEQLEVKITTKGKEVEIEGSAENEYIAEKVIMAIDIGFPFEEAFLIKDEEFLFEEMNIKSHTKRNDLERIRARIIGTQGKTRNTLEQLTDCFIEIKDNEIGMIGPADRIHQLEQALISIIKGSKQANVYAHLEKYRPLPIPDFAFKKQK